MAVRISRELRNEIILAANRKFEPSTTLARESKPNIDGDYIYDQVWGPHREQMEALPKEFFPYKNQMTIQRVAGANVSVIASFSQSRPIPGIPAAMTGLIVLGYSDYSLSDHQVWASIIADVKAWEARCFAANTRKQDFVKGVTAVLDSFSTLAPALKEWPPLWELVPDHAKERHEEIKERAKSDKPSMDKDRLGAMTGALSAIKMGVL